MDEMPRPPGPKTIMVSGRASYEKWKAAMNAADKHVRGMTPTEVIVDEGVAWRYMEPDEMDRALLGGRLVDLVAQDEVALVAIVTKNGPSIIYRSSEDGEHVKRIGHTGEVSFEHDPHMWVSSVKLTGIGAPPDDPGQA